MPKIITKTLYQFDELSDDAKERAREWYTDDGEAWVWQSEWWNSAQAFSQIAPIEIRGADYDRRHVDIRWTGDDAVAELSGVRAWKWLQNNDWFAWAARNKAGECTMTGYCGDCPFGDAIDDYARRPTAIPELKQVFYEAAQAWVNEAANDCEHAYSNESVDEMLSANEYWFDDKGNIS